MLVPLILLACSLLLNAFLLISRTGANAADVADSADSSGTADGAVAVFDGAGSLKILPSVTVTVDGTLGCEKLRVGELLIDFSNNARSEHAIVSAVGNSLKFSATAKVFPDGTLQCARLKVNDLQFGVLDVSKNGLLGIAGATGSVFSIPIDGLARYSGEVAKPNSLMLIDEEGKLSPSTLTLKSADVSRDGFLHVSASGELSTDPKNEEPLVFDGQKGSLPEDGIACFTSDGKISSSNVVRLNKVSVLGARDGSLLQTFRGEIRASPNMHVKLAPGSSVTPDTIPLFSDASGEYVRPSDFKINLTEPDFDDGDAGKTELLAYDRKSGSVVRKGLGSILNGPRGKRRLPMFDESGNLRASDVEFEVEDDHSDGFLVLEAGSVRASPLSPSQFLKASSLSDWAEGALLYATTHGHGDSDELRVESLRFGFDDDARNYSKNTVLSFDGEHFLFRNLDEFVTTAPGFDPATTVHGDHLPCVKMADDGTSQLDSSGVYVKGSTLVVPEGTNLKIGSVTIDNSTPSKPPKANDLLTFDGSKFSFAPALPSERPVGSILRVNNFNELEFEVPRAPAPPVTVVGNERIFVSKNYTTLATHAFRAPAYNVTCHYSATAAWMTNESNPEAVMFRLAFQEAGTGLQIHTKQIMQFPSIHGDKLWHAITPTVSEIETCEHGAGLVSVSLQARCGADLTDAVACNLKRREYAKEGDFPDLFSMLTIFVR